MTLMTPSEVTDQLLSMQCCDCGAPDNRYKGRCARCAAAKYGVEEEHYRDRHPVIMIDENDL